MLFCSLQWHTFCFTPHRIFDVAYTYKYTWMVIFYFGFLARPNPSTNTRSFLRINIHHRNESRTVDKMIRFGWTISKRIIRFRWLFSLFSSFFILPGTYMRIARIQKCSRAFELFISVCYNHLKFILTLCIRCGNSICFSFATCYLLLLCSIEFRVGTHRVI